MRIVILESSPNRHGSSNLLAERFAQGAQEAGHQVAFVDVAHADIHPCTGCVHCGYEGALRPEGRRGGHPPAAAGRRHGGLCHPSVLLRHVRPAEDHGGPVLRLQQQPAGQALEVRPAGRRLEQRYLDLRRPGGPLPDPGPLPEPPGHGHGPGHRLRHPRHDGPLPPSPRRPTAWAASSCEAGGRPGGGGPAHDPGPVVPHGVPPVGGSRPTNGWGPGPWPSSWSTTSSTAGGTPP